MRVSVSRWFWEGIQTLGFQDIPKIPLSQPLRVCKAECVQSNISVHVNLWVPHPTKHKQVSKATTEPSVFAMVWEGIQTLGFQDEFRNAFKPTFSSMWSWMCLDRHFRTFEVLCTPPHKTQKSIQNDHQFVRFRNGLGWHPNLRFSRQFGTIDWLES